MFSITRRTSLARIIRGSASTKRFAHAPIPFDWKDPLNSATRFSEEEIAVQETARAYCQDRLLPRVLGTDTVKIRPCANVSH